MTDDAKCPSRFLAWASPVILAVACGLFFRHLTYETDLNEVIYRSGTDNMLTVCDSIPNLLGMMRNDDPSDAYIYFRHRPAFTTSEVEALRRGYFRKWWIV